MEIIELTVLWVVVVVAVVVTDGGVTDLGREIFGIGGDDDGVLLLMVVRLLFEVGKKINDFALVSRSFRQ